MISNLHFSAIVLLSTLFGDAYYTEATVTGATLKITVQKPIDEQKAIAIIAWLRDTAGHINQVYGRFPNPALKIEVIPASTRFPGRTKAVQFGQVTRDEGGTVKLYINADRPIEEFYKDWTLTHEFSHLMLPSLQSRHRWISEGFASYYQNVLLARAGHYSQEDAWSRLTQGFERGRHSKPGLSLNEAAAGNIFAARMKIYWSGAVIALMADVELRQRSGGKESLDSVLGQLQQCCLPTQHLWSGRRLFRKLDSFIDEPVFMPLYRRHANSAGFPDPGPTLASLGVNANRNSVNLSDTATLADVRTAISGPAN